MAIEIDGDPARQELDYTLGRQTLMFVNCWPLSRLLAWLSDPSQECRR